MKSWELSAGNSISRGYALADSRIIWAGRTLHGTDRFGRWVTKRDEFDGWWDSPDIKGESTDHANADGEYDLPTYNQARILTISGHLHTENAKVQQSAMHHLSGPMLGRLQVELHGSTLWADAKRTASVNFNPVTDKLLQWQVRLKCPDPRKFADRNLFTVAGGGSADVYHYGNYAASPVVTITGDAPNGYTITGPNGKLFSCIAPLTTAQTHVVDFRDGLLRINGYYWTGYMGQADVWTVGAGQKVPMGLTVPAGTATASISVLDTFI